MVVLWWGYCGFSGLGFLCAGVAQFSRLWLGFWVGFGVCLDVCGLFGYLGLV